MRRKNASSPSPSPPPPPPPPPSSSLPSVPPASSSSSSSYAASSINNASFNNGTGGDNAGGKMSSNKRPTRGGDLRVAPKINRDDDKKRAFSYTHMINSALPPRLKLLKARHKKTFFFLVFVFATLVLASTWMGLSALYFSDEDDYADTYSIDEWRRYYRRRFRFFRNPLTAMLSVFRRRDERSLRKGEDDDDDGAEEADASGFASWVLIPNRTRLKLTIPKNASSSSSLFLASTTLARQVVSPYTHSKTGRRTFGCLRFECRGLAMEDLTDRDWRMLYKSGKMSEESSEFKPNLYFKTTLLLTDGTDLTKLQRQNPAAYHSIVTAQEGKTYLEAIENAEHIGGNKGQQLRTKVHFLERKRTRHLCDYNALHIQPRQYRLYIKKECEDFLLQQKRMKKTFLLKPETGSQGQGITYHTSTNSIARKAPEFFPCRDNLTLVATARYLVQEYIARPLLIKRSKFDARVYMLIASTTPYLVFYREGYLRRSLHAYNPDSKDRAVHLTNTHYQSMKEGFKLSDHVWTFEAMQNYLTVNTDTGSHFVDAVLEPYIKRVANFVFQTARSKLKKRRGSFNIFGLDFMVDDVYKIHFIEANGYPGYTWSLNYDSRGLVTDVMDLVLELHESPAAFERMTAGDSYGGFNMIFSELEERKSGFAYDACFEFHNNDGYFKIMRPAMRRFAKFSAFAKVKLKDAYEDDEEEENCRTSKLCKAKRKLAAKEANKQKSTLDRAFENLVDDLGVEATNAIAGSKATQLETLANFVAKTGKREGVAQIAERKSREANDGTAEEEDEAGTDDDRGGRRKGGGARCTFNELGISPASYRWDVEAECVRAVKYRTPSSWIAKPYHHAGNVGGGFLFVKSQKDLLSDVGGLTKDATPEEGCKAMRQPYLVQRRLTNSIELDGSTWSFRSYMLIASTRPFFVFHYPGYARSARFERVNPEDEREGEKVVLGEREVTMEEIQHFIDAHKIAGAKFVQTHIETFQRRVAELVFRAARDKIAHVPKAHQIFELDFIMDDSLRMYYLHANAAPNFPSRIPINSKMQEDLRPLVLELVDTPEAFAGMRPGDAYGNFRLVASDYADLTLGASREQTLQRRYDPCKEFKKKWAMNPVSAKFTNELHDVATRAHRANERELKKFVSAKWSSCRTKGKSVNTCGQQLREFVRGRYESFLRKERRFQELENKNEIDEWVDRKIAELMGLTVAEDGGDGEGGGGGEETGGGREESREGNSPERKKGATSKKKTED